MPELEVTQDQLDRLDALRERLADEVVGKYGTVRRRDALEYLLDNLDDEDVAAASAGETAASAGDAAGTDGTDDGETATATDADGAEDDEDESADAAADGTAASTTASGPTPTPPGEGDGGSKLNAMMSLLEDNADVWGEASGGEEKYVVELPDGSTERARTKDDVRALLFKHYR